MKCAWQAFINLLPVWMRSPVDRHGKETLQELRLRLSLPPVLITQAGAVILEREVNADDLRFVINVASRYSPWAAATSAQGYVTAPGGHRIGLCGMAVTDKGHMTGIREPTSLCLRIARDFPGLAEAAGRIPGSILIIGKPGSGKTTFLRDLIRQKSEAGCGSIAVVDEREEIFPKWHDQNCFFAGRHTDVLSGCRKTEGIESVLRCMGPSVIAIDEITAEADCTALLHAGWCGVKLLATAHAGSVSDLKKRPVYRPILDSRLFETVIVLHADKTWKVERMDL